MQDSTPFATAYLQAGILSELDCSPTYDWCIDLGMRLESVGISQSHVRQGAQRGLKAMPLEISVADLQNDCKHIIQILENNGLPATQVGLVGPGVLSFSRDTIGEVLAAVSRYRPDARVLSTFIRLGAACTALHWANCIIKTPDEDRRRQNLYPSYPLSGDTILHSSYTAGVISAHVAGVVEDYFAMSPLAAPQHHSLSMKALGWLLQSQLRLIRPSRNSLTPDAVMQILQRTKDHKITIHALVPSTNLENQPLMRTSEQLRAIDIALQGGRYSRQFELVKAPAARKQDLHNACKADILHLAGHGSGVDVLFQGDSMGNGYGLDIADLANILKAWKTVKVVVLNACYSYQDAEYLAESIPIVISMQGKITDQMAIEFSAHFYQAFADGADLLDAFELGRAMAEALIPIEWHDDENFYLFYSDFFDPQLFESGLWISS